MAVPSPRIGPAHGEIEERIAEKVSAPAVISDVSPPVQETAPVIKEKIAEEKKEEEKKPSNILFAEPEVYGDIKMEITSEDESVHAAQIKVMFKEYPKSRRNQTIYRYEMKPRQVKPVVKRSPSKKTTILIDIASEGIYDIVVENPAGPLSAHFTLKIYEKKGNAQTRDLGIRTVGQGGLITKILMPEGVLWDDDAYFSGSIEDSESFTKFNNDTGVIWKEFKE
jgi:hypothetical protein